MERIAIIGATGLIGTNIGASLASRGFHLVKVARHVEGNALSQSGVVWKAADIGRTSRVEWAVLFEGVAAVVNCAGALQDGPSDDLDATHRSGLSDLIAGCRAAGVTRFIHFRPWASTERGRRSFRRRSKLAMRFFPAVTWIG